MNPNKDQVSLNQAISGSYDNQAEALRIKVADGLELAIALSAEDGDSVISKSPLIEVGNDVVNVSGTSKVTLYGAGKLLVSVDGMMFYALIEQSLESIPASKDVVARFAKTQGNCKALFGR